MQHLFMSIWILNGNFQFNVEIWTEVAVAYSSLYYWNEFIFSSLFHLPVCFHFGFLLAQIRNIFRRISEYPIGLVSQKFAIVMRINCEMWAATLVHEQHDIGFCDMRWYTIFPIIEWFSTNKELALLYSKCAILC